MTVMHYMHTFSLQAYALIMTFKLAGCPKLIVFSPGDNHHSGMFKVFRHQLNRIISKSLWHERWALDVIKEFKYAWYTWKDTDCAHTLSLSLKPSLSLSVSYSFSVCHTPHHKHTHTWCCPLCVTVSAHMQCSIMFHWCQSMTNNNGISIQNWSGYQN